MEWSDPILKRAAYISKQADLNSFAHGIVSGDSLAGTAARFIPGISTGLYANDAVNAFKGGRMWAGIGHGIQAGVSLLPGLGGGLAKTLGGIGTAAKFGGGLLAGGATASKFLGKVPGIGGALSRGLGGGGLIGHIPGVSKIPTLMGGAKAIGNTASRVGGWGVDHLQGIENVLQNTVSGGLKMIPGMKSVAANPLVQGAKTHSGITGFVGGTSGAAAAPGMVGLGDWSLPGMANRIQGGLDSSKSMAAQEGDNMMSNLSRLRMSGFGNQDPRFTNPTAQSIYP